MTSKGVQVRVRSSIRFKPPPRVERDENEFCRRWGKLCHGCCSCQADPMRPKHLDENTVVHRYNPGNYKLYGLPVPKLNQVLGLVGPSVIGKSVVFDIFSRKVTPNLGCPENPPTWEEIFEYFKDTNDNMYNYFTRIVQDQVKVCVTQDTEFFARRGLQGIVGELLDRKDETGMKAEICSELGINQILKRNLVHLSSGEFQSFLPYLKNSGSQRSDAGKSTIGGQILFLIGQVDERTIQKNEREAKDKSRKSWFLQGPETDPTTVRKIRDASITIRMLLSNLLTILKLAINSEICFIYSLCVTRRRGSVFHWGTTRWKQTC